MPDARTSALDGFITDVGRIVIRGGGEALVTAGVAECMAQLLASGPFLDPAYIEPDPERYVMYPLYVSPDASFSIASAVWGVGQATPVHDHGTWGVIGIYSGIEEEHRYEIADVCLRHTETRTLRAGDVEVCCTSDADIHSVRCASSVPCVGIHVYGADIGVLPRRAYDAGGHPKSFVSSWAVPSARRADAR